MYVRLLTLCVAHIHVHLGATTIIYKLHVHIHVGTATVTYSSHTRTSECDYIKI
jgi:hypothetical protein